MRSRISRCAPVGELLLGLTGVLVLLPVLIAQARSGCNGEASCSKDAYALGTLAVAAFSGACVFLAWLVWPFARNKRPLPCELAGRMLPTVMLSASVLFAYAFAMSLFNRWWSTTYAVLILLVAVAQFVLHDVLEDASVHPEVRS